MITEKNPRLREPEVRRAFEEGLLVGEATDTVEALLESLGLRRSELARRLGVNRSRVTQVLSGNENLTLKTLGALGWALGIRFEIRATPMADRKGTPAEEDPAPPAWLSRLEGGAHWRFDHVSMPNSGRVPAKRPSLRVIDGQARAA